jgi:hypothetical protein
MTIPCLQKNRNRPAHAGDTEGRGQQNGRLESNAALSSRSGFFLFGRCGLSFDVTGAAFAFQKFVVLSSHKSLLFSRNAVLS